MSHILGTIVKCWLQQRRCEFDSMRCNQIRFKIGLAKILTLDKNDSHGRKKKFRIPIDLKFKILPENNQLKILEFAELNIRLFWFEQHQRVSETQF